MVFGLKDENNLSIADSVIQGNVTNIGTSIQTSERVTCEICLASGNLTTFVCDESMCKTKFCEYCRDSQYPTKCRNCIQEINLKIQRELAEMERVRRKAAEEKRLEKEREDERILKEKLRLLKEEEEIQRKEHAEKMTHYNSTSARLMRMWFLIVPLQQLIYLYVLLNFVITLRPAIPGEDTDGVTLGFICLTIFFTGLIMWLPTYSPGTTDRFSLAETGYAPIVATIFLLSPLISSFLSVFFTLTLGMVFLEIFLLLSILGIVMMVISWVMD